MVNIFNRMMEQLKNERLRLREQNNFLDLLIKASPMGVIITSLDEDLSELNPMALKMLGVRLEDVQGKKMKEIDSPLAVELANITGDLHQIALNGISLNLRDNEFVAILGPSGSGKTTLLNIIGGLDRYDSGDLIINGISTKRYKDRDWDSYRNHTIGFVFQSYNLIPHQTVLANVELALTISGISKNERRKRAIDAL